MNDISANRMKKQTKPERSVGDPLKGATLESMERLLDPIVSLMLDMGVTVQELNQIARKRFVRMAAKRVRNEIGRESKSRVSIMTGLPRSEVTKILDDRESSARKKGMEQHPSRRVLAGWFDTPYFSDVDGQPAVLPIYGKARTFQKLVERFGGGIPVRAMLDELTQLDAIERLPDQKVKAKARVPILTGLTKQAITAIGERGRDLLETLVGNTKANRPLFEATEMIDDSDESMASLVRREIAEQGANFINTATSLVNRSRTKNLTKPGETSKGVRLGVTVYYFESIPLTVDEAEAQSKPVRRKNLRRRKI